MIKKSLKYFGIVFINLIILLILLNIWIDDFELEFNGGVFFLENLKLIGISILGIILLRVAVYLFRNFKIKSLKIKMVISTGIIILISGYFYTDYSNRIYQNQFLDKELRNGIVKKTKPIEGGWYGSQAENLTKEEYNEITKIKWFPKLPNDAENISYDYEYEGFLPDYSFSLSYDLPMNSEVDTLSYEEGTFSKRRNYEIIDNKKRVTYYEGQW